MTSDISQKEYDLLIIGGGPAGLTAAAYAVRKRIETMLISEDLGGKTNYKFSLPDVETHLIIDGEELVNRFKSQLEYLDFARHLGKVTKFQRTGKTFTATTADQTFKGKTAIIATGVMPKRLQVPGEEEFLGHGVSYSTVSHAPVHRHGRCRRRRRNAGASSSSRAGANRKESECDWRTKQAHRISISQEDQGFR